MSSGWVPTALTPGFPRRFRGAWEAAEAAEAVAEAEVEAKGKASRSSSSLESMAAGTPVVMARRDTEAGAAAAVAGAVG